MMLCTEFMQKRDCPVVGSLKYGNELSDFVRGEESPNQLSYY